MAWKTWVGSVSGDYSVAGNWLEGAIPVATNDVRIPASSVQAITAGLNQSAVALASFVVEQGYTQTIGSSTANLQINVGAGRFEFNGSGLAYIDLGNSTCSPRILGTASPSTGTRGLYLIGSAMAVVDCQGGHTGIAALPSQVATITTARTSGNATCWLGLGCTVTNVQPHGGSMIVRCNATNITVYAGILTTEEAGTCGTLTVYGGTVYPNSTGTITAAVLNGGTTDFTKSGAARTVTTMTQNAGSTLVYDPAIVTLTNRAAPSSAVSIYAQAA